MNMIFQYSRTPKPIIFILILSLFFLFLLLAPGNLLATPPQEALSAKEAGDNYSHQGNIQEGIKAYERALQIYPLFAEVYYLLGMIYDMDQGRPEEGIKLYQKFLELAPDSPEAETVRFLIENAQQILSGSSSSTSIVKKEDPQKIVTAPTTVKESPSPSQNKYIQRSIKTKVLKYTLKLNVWKREGFIEKFNELAMARGSFLTNDISKKRLQLRLDRQICTEHIDYQQEAEIFVQRQILNDLLEEEMSIFLSHFPEKINIQEAIVRSEVKKIREDKKYVRLTMDARINLENLKGQLSSLGYQFIPTKILLYCTNLYGDFSEQFMEAISRKSKYTKKESEGLVEIYTKPEEFVKELNNMKVGPYTIKVDKVDKNNITFIAEKEQ